MRLILSCINRGKQITEKDKLLLMVNTKTEETNWIPLKIQETNEIIGSKGLCMSGDYLMVSLMTNKKSDKLVIIDVVTEKHNLTNCIKSKDICGMISVFRGRVYALATGIDAMTNIVLSPSTNNIIRDVNHYSIDGAGNDNYHLSSIVNWNRRWYVTSWGLGWRDDDSNGSIIELSKNNRIVYSNLKHPNNIFFNRNDEMCFLESGKGLFHFGRNIIYTGSGYPEGVIEDRDENGYWIACTGHDVTPRLKFFNYDGEYTNSIDLPYGYNFKNIIESEGYLSKLL